MSNRKRQKHPMPDFISEALKSSGLVDAYNERPPYQQNDYIGWITSTKRPATRQKRLEQMLDELRRGGVYMNMKHEPSKSWAPL